MTEEKPKKPRLKGFAKLMGGLINSVENKPEFKEFIRGIKTRVLFNNQEDKNYACLFTIKDDKIKVECIKKEDKNSLSRKKLYWWGYWEFPNLQAMMGAGSWGSGKWIRKMAVGKVIGASQISKIAVKSSMGLRQTKRYLNRFSVMGSFQILHSNTFPPKVSSTPQLTVILGLPQIICGIVNIATINAIKLMTKAASVMPQLYHF